MLIVILEVAVFEPNKQTMRQENSVVNNKFNKDNREFLSRAYELIVVLTVRNVLNYHLSVFWNIYLRKLKCSWLTISPYGPIFCYKRSPVRSTEWDKARGVAREERYLPRATSPSFGRSFRSPFAYHNVAAWPIRLHICIGIVVEHKKIHNKKFHERR